MSAAGPTEPSGLHPWHFFVVASLLAATTAVVVARDSSVGNLALISLAVFGAGLAGFFFHRTLWALVAPDEEASTVEVGGRTRMALEREKALVLRAIKELEFDQAMGKVAEGDFHDMLGRLRARAIGLLKRLDERPAAYRELIERELAQRLAARGVAPAPVPAAGTAATFCTQCGTRNEADAKFCKSCGRPLAS